MKPEQAENLYVETLLRRSAEAGKIPLSEEFDVMKLTGDASTRRYYRVKTQRHKYVVCLDHPEEKAENNFTEIQKVLKENGCRVPMIYDQRLKKGYLLEEDLGDDTFLKIVSRLSSNKEVKDMYVRAVDLMIKIHGIDGEKYQEAVFNSYCFDQKKLLEEVNLTHKNFLEGYLSSKVSEKDRNTLDQYFGEITHKISMLPMVLTHRDYHSRNIMYKDDQLVAIDFQDARMGVPQYDLVSLIEDCYFGIDEEDKLALKQYYWEKFLSEKSLGQNQEEYLRVYDLVAIQRIYKAIGSFSFIYLTRADARYLKYIGGAFENLKKILKRSGYIELTLLLSRYYYDS
jgi:aminoglycoside/choline kinase family phosphotransferase